MPSFRVTDDDQWVEVDPNSEKPIRVKKEPKPARRAQPEIVPYVDQMSVAAQQATPRFLPSPAEQRVTLKTTYKDRATAFNYKVAPVAALTGAVAGLVGWHFAAVPLLSGTMLVLLVGGFGLVWLAAYVVSEVLSPDGVSLAHVLLGFGLLYRQQGEQLRQQRERHDFAMQQARQQAAQNAQGAHSDTELR